MKTVLITGAAGAIGQIIGNALFKEYKVIGLDSVVPKKSKFEIKNFDLTSDGGIDIGEIDYCLHLAALTDAKSCSENPALADKVNIGGTSKVLELCKKANCKKFIYISTGGVYGFSKEDGKEFSEGDEPKPFDVYSSTKYKGELEAEKYKEFFSVVVLRLFFPYGHGTSKNSLINRLIRNIMGSKPIFLNDDDEPTINPIFITDLVSVVKNMLEGGSEGTYNIAGSEVMNIKQISEAICSILGTEPVFNKTGKDVGNMIGNIGKLKNEVRFTPEVTLNEGLKLVVESIQNEP